MGIHRELEAIGATKIGQIGRTHGYDARIEGFCTADPPCYRTVSYCRIVRRITSLNEAWTFTCSEWEKPPGKLSFSTHEPRPATVPGHVHLDLMDNGVIQDPFECCYELGCQWVDDEDWSYSRAFSFRPDRALPRQVLRFDGLDTACRVYLNGSLLAEHDNMFVPLEIDATQRLISGTNQLRVEFIAAKKEGQKRRSAYFAAQGISENTVRLDPRAFLRKAQYMYGWDWGPSLVSVGIYRPVSLIEHAGRLLDVRVEQRHNADGTIELRMSSELETPSPEEVATTYHFVEGIASPIADGQWLKIERPRVWWPNGMGSQELYAIDSGLFTFTPRSRADLEAALDRKEQRIGLRTIEVRRDNDEWGRSFRFVVNGRDCYALGANWIPDDSFTSRVTIEQVRAQLERAVDLRMNMLRVWGGGFYETDEFYDLCDELGLMVWQDFPYACSYYPDDGAACDVAREEARSNIVRLRNHPSLALWCGNNENQAMRDDGWDGVERQPVRFEGERIWDKVLPELVAQLDGQRTYIKTSPFGEGRANSGIDGDQHYWEVWHGKGDWKYYLGSDARFCSEFGFASAPGHATWIRIAPGRNLLAADVRDPVARWHDKTAKGYQTFLAYVELHYPRSHTIEEWTYYSQLNQRDALRYGIEHYRRSSFCRGTLVWQLNDCWPAQSWAVVDACFHYKAAAYELRRLYAPILLSVEQVGNQLRIWGIADNVEQPIEREFTLELRRLSDGQRLQEHSVFARISPGERRVLIEQSLDSVSQWDTIVVASDGVNSTYRLLAEPKDVTLLASALAVAVEEGCVTVYTPVPVVDLCLWDERGEAVFLDNFVTLAEPGCACLRYRGDLTKLIARSLAGHHDLTAKG